MSMNMDKVRQVGSEWKHPRTGEARYYLNEWHDMIEGLKIGRYNTGNISSATLDGEKISNGKAGKTINQVDKVWISADGDIHVIGHENSKALMTLSEISDRIESFFYI